MKTGRKPYVTRRPITPEDIRSAATPLGRKSLIDQYASHPQRDAILAAVGDAMHQWVDYDSSAALLAWRSGQINQQHGLG